MATLQHEVAHLPCDNSDRSLSKATQQSLPTYAASWHSACQSVRWAGVEGLQRVGGGQIVRTEPKPYRKLASLRFAGRCPTIDALLRVDSTLLQRFRKSRRFKTLR